MQGYYTDYDETLSSEEKILATFSPSACRCRYRNERTNNVTHLRCTRLAHRAEPIFGDASGLSVPHNMQAAVRLGRGQTVGRRGGMWDGMGPRQAEAEFPPRPRRNLKPLRRSRWDCIARLYALVPVAVLRRSQITYNFVWCPSYTTYTRISTLLVRAAHWNKICVCTYKRMRVLLPIKTHFLYSLAKRMLMISNNRPHTAIYWIHVCIIHIKHYLRHCYRQNYVILDKEMHCLIKISELAGNNYFIDHLVNLKTQ